ncbi:MAG: hypothetical protein IKS21_04650 [Oscillospiraceae bacterium]|nr:hypothetical protein [Oscillospiraceae bacterium]
MWEFIFFAEYFPFDEEKEKKFPISSKKVEKIGTSNDAFIGVLRAGRNAYTSALQGSDNPSSIRIEYDSYRLHRTI